MKQKTFFRKHTLTKLSIFTVLLVAFLQINSYPAFLTNTGEIFFQQNSNTLSVPLSVQAADNSKFIETYIINGASYIFKSYAYTLQAMQMVETSTPNTLDLNALKIILRNSIQNTTNAVLVYRNLKATADTTPYNPIMVQKLQNFDYFSYCYNNNLNETTMWKVASYLYYGDVRGTFSYLLNQFESILKLQQSILASLETVKFPEIANIWRLNHQFSDCLMFGQYCAQIFDEIKSN